MKDRRGAADPLSVARDLLSRGIMPLPVLPSEKNPIIPKWQHLTITTADVDQFFNGADLNVGARWGAKSRNLVDVDLDCAEAVKLAPHFLPATHSIYGRPNKPRSHYLYTCSDADPKGSIPLKDDNKKMILELRFGGGDKGAQSVMPGSRHQSGEFYEWNEDGEQADVACAALKAARMKIGVGVLLMRNWPDECPTSTRHDLSLGVGGFLARAGWSADDIHHFVEVLCIATDGADFAHDHARTAKESAEVFVNTGEGRGFPWMKEEFGETVAKQIAKIVGYRDRDAVTSAEGFEIDHNNRLINNSQKNIRHALELLEVELRYDMFHDRTIIIGMEDHTFLDDAAMERLWLTIDEQFRFRASIDFFRIVLSDAGRRNAFHPVRDYLDGLVWDGVERLDKWLVTYGGAEDTKYVRAVGAITLVAAVRRIRHPGCKFDEMLILESPQGKDKSTMLAILAVSSDYFTDDLPLTSDTKKVMEQLKGKWIVEAADMSGMRKAGVEHLKAMLSRRVDSSRMAYGRNTTEQPRQSVVIGTTNDTIYLKDLTGNRRFWPVKIMDIDLDAFKRDRDQLWAEAAAREAEDVSIRLDPSLWEAAAEQQTERTIRDPWFELLDDVLDGLNGKLLAADAWKIVDMAASHRTQEHNLRFGRAMKDLGFERKNLNFDGRVQKGYARGTALEQLKRIYVDRHRSHVFAALEKETVDAAVGAAVGNENM